MNEQALLLEKIFDQVCHLLHEFQQAQTNHPNPVHPTQPTRKPHDPSTHKANFDGAMFADSREAGIRVTVLNSLRGNYGSFVWKNPHAIFTS